MLSNCCLKFKSAQFTQRVTQIKEVGLSPYPLFRTLQCVQWNFPLQINCHFSQNELSSPIAANFCPTFFWPRFSFLCYFLLMGIGQLKMMSKKVLIQKFHSFSVTKSTTGFECELCYCDEVYLYIPNFLQD